jgi:hypothetical protein
MGHVKKAIRSSFVQLTLFVALAVAAAFSFVRYLEWSFGYSGVLGLPTQTKLAQLAVRRACLFFCMFVMLEIALVAIVASHWEPSALDSAGYRFVSRCGVGVLVSIFVTALLVGVGFVVRAW